MTGIEQDTRRYPVVVTGTIVHIVMAPGTSQADAIAYADEYGNELMTSGNTVDAWWTVAVPEPDEVEEGLRLAAGSLDHDAHVLTHRRHVCAAAGHPNPETSPYNPEQLFCVTCCKFVSIGVPA